MERMGSLIIQIQKIKLMQALIATSRSISQDVFLQKQSKRKYEQHMSKVSSIRALKQFPIIQQMKESEKLAKTIYKHKQAAKTFRENEQKIETKRENRILLQKIWKIHSNLKTDNNIMHLQHQSGSNWNYKRRQAETIKEQNKKFVNQLYSTKVDVKDYKKKLEVEIKEYLELRSNIRKCNYESEKKLRIKRTKSERKGFNLKLKDDDDEKKQFSSQKVVEGQEKKRAVTKSSDKRVVYEEKQEIKGEGPIEEKEECEDIKDESQ